MERDCEKRASDRRRRLSDLVRYFHFNVPASSQSPHMRGRRPSLTGNPVYQENRILQQVRARDIVFLLSSGVGLPQNNRVQTSLVFALTRRWLRWLGKKA